MTAPSQTSLAPFTAAPEIDAALVRELHATSGGEAWDVSPDGFRDVLCISLRHAFAGRPVPPTDAARYVTALHVRDLALATACAAGHAGAWDVFVREHQTGLRRAAQALDPGGGAYDLADSLFGELFGLREQHGVRQSLFRYFHGRSNLGTWLRAVLSQRYVDRVRAERRMRPMPDESALPERLHARPAADPERARFIETLRSALAVALAALAPRDRLRLACYYVQHLTLAAIGRLLVEHEATVSRHLTRTRAELRAGVDRRLRDAHGLDPRAVDECVRAAIDDPGSLDLTQLIAIDPGTDLWCKKSGRPRSET